MQTLRTAYTKYRMKCTVASAFHWPSLPIESGAPIGLLCKIIFIIIPYSMEKHFHSRVMSEVYTADDAVDILYNNGWICS